MLLSTDAASDSLSLSAALHSVRAVEVVWALKIDSLSVSLWYPDMAASCLNVPPDHTRNKNHRCICQFRLDRTICSLREPRKSPIQKTWMYDVCRNKKRNAYQRDTKEADKARSMGRVDGR